MVPREPQEHGLTPISGDHARRELSNPTRKPDSQRPSLAQPGVTTAHRIRAAIADDHRLMLDSIARALEAAGDTTVVGQAASGEELIALVPGVRPDGVLVDLKMPALGGMSTVRSLRV